MKPAIQGIERPSGEIFCFEEFRHRWDILKETMDEMRKFAEEFATGEKLVGAIFISLNIGEDRDSCTLGFEYPENAKMEERLNRVYTAKGIKEWAKDLPPEEREAYFQDARRNGLGEWL
jgi:hypothetical protein